MKNHYTPRIGFLLLFLSLPFFSIAQNNCLDITLFGNAVCDDNGTPGNPSDDTWTIEAIVHDPTGSGTTWVANDPNGSSGMYDVLTVIGPFTTDLIYVYFSDAANEECFTNTVFATNPCAGSNPCGMNVSTLTFGCNMGPTNSPSDNTFVFVSNVTGGPGTTSSWYADDPLNSTGIYGGQVNFGYYDAVSAPIMFTIYDSNNPACTYTVSFVPFNCHPFVCDLLDPGFLDLTCVDPGTPGDPTDDVWSFTLNPLGFALANGYVVSVSNGSLNLSGGIYGFPNGFTWTNTSGASSFELTITDDNDPACTITIPITLPPGGCAFACEITPLVNTNSIACNDNGTPTDPSDDTFTFNATITGTDVGASWLANDPNLTSGLYDIPQTFGPYPIASGPLSFTITDIDDPTCSEIVLVNPPPTCSNQIPCNLTDAGLGTITCDDNGTPTFPDDDILVIELNPGGTGLGTSYVVTSPLLTTSPGGGLYGGITSQQFLNAGALASPTIPITITDVDDPTCSITINVPNQSPCVTCDIDVILNANTCNDNGTPNDPLDDTYTVLAFVSGTGTSWSANDPNATNGFHNIPFSFGPYLIIDGIQNFEVVDDSDPNCFFSVSLTPPTPCSIPGPCVIGANAVIFPCNDNGTPSDPSDDTFTFTITVTGLGNMGSGWTDGTNLGSYGVPSVYGPLPISDGNVILNFADLDDPTCTAFISVAPPNTCSNQSPCSIAASSDNILCDDNGTPSDPSDDTFSFDISLTGSNTGSGWTDGTSNGNYGIASTYGPFPISGGDINLNFADLDDPACTTSISVAAPNTCSNSCNIDLSIDDYTCNDNNTPNDPSDDTYTVLTVVSGTGTTWSANDPDNSTGLHNTFFTFGPYLISDGPIVFDVVDDLDPTCTFAVTFTPPGPNTCVNQTPCIITDVGLSNVMCDDNGTPGFPDDDIITFDLTPTGTGIASTYFLFATLVTVSPSSGAYNSTTTFQMTGVGTSTQALIPIILSDFDEQTCFIVVNIPNITPCSNCQIDAIPETYFCDDAGTPVDTLDDTYTVEVLVTGNGTSWNANDPNNTTGLNNTTTTFGPYLISDGILTFDIFDDADTSCVTSLTLTPPAPCSTPSTCTIAAAFYDILCADNGSPNDPNDDTFTFAVFVTGFGPIVGASWTADDPNNTTGLYGVEQTFGPYPISGGPISFNITDIDDSNCTQTLTVLPPPVCSNPSSCVINNVDVGEFFCNDNGTPGNPDDDIVTFFAFPTGIDIGTQYSISTPGYTISPATGTYGSFTFFDILDAGSSTDPFFQITITDLNDPGCFIVFSVPNLAPCSNCSILANTGTYTCDDNGTFANPNDDTYTVNVTIVGTGTSWNANDPNSSIGSINSSFTFGPFLISDGVLTFQIFDDSDPSCFTSITLTPPAPCSTIPSCIILPIAYWDILCDDNGTPNDPNDDTFTFTINTLGNGVGTSWTADDPSNTTGSYQVPQTVGPYLISDGPANLTITDIDDPNCTQTVVVQAPPPCSIPAPCSIVANSTLFCNDNGTPNDPSDDTFTFDLTVSGFNTGSGWTDGTLLGIYDTATTYGPFPISGGDISISYNDINDPTCQNSIVISPPAPCSNPGPCSIVANAVLFCNDNGTPNDPSDDTFTFDLTVSGFNSGSGWTDGTLLGIYDTATTYGPFPISGGDITISYNDIDDPTCQNAIVISPPAPCSNPGPCSIVANAVLFCNDNGTPNDPGDDTFTIDLTVSGFNTGSGWTDGTLLGIYDTATTFGPFPISGGDITISYNDIDDPTCQNTIVISPPSACSNPCTITANSSNVICNDNGTAMDPSDDTFTFDLTVTATNAGSGWTDGILSGNYGMLTTYGPFPISGGDITININDLDDPICQTSIVISPPNTCSNTCALFASSANLTCQDNGTPGDPSDDTFNFEITVTGSNTGIAWTDGSIVSSYGTPFSYGPFPIAGGDITLNIADLDDPTCQTSIIITPPNTCSNTCSLSANTLNINCNDNNTSSDPSDDFYTFDITVTGFNTGSGWTDGFNIGSYGITETYGPFPIAAGDQFLTFSDLDDPSCQTSILVSPPNTCSNLCIINASALNILCNDNGTNDDPTDDTFTFDITVDGINTGTGWTDGTISEVYGTISTYGPFPISGGDITLNINDINDLTCQTSVLIPVPNTCSNCTQTVDAGIGGEITCAKDSVLLTATSSANGSYSWTGPNFSLAGSLTATVTEAGVYYFSADFSNNCFKTDSVIVTIDSLIPTADGGLDTFLTCLQDSVYLFGTLLPGQTGQWLNSLNQVVSPSNELLVTQAGSYFYQVTNQSNGCASPLDEVVVTEQSSAPLAVIFSDPTDTLDCVILSINLFTITEPDVVYTWEGNGEIVITSQISVNQGGTYILTALDTLSGCSSLDSINIDDLEEYPFIDISPNNVITCEFPSIILDASASQMGGSIVYTWFDEDFLPIPNANDNFLEVSTGGFYYLELIDLNNDCKNIDTVFVDTDIELPDLEVEDPINLFCGSSNTDLIATTTSNLSNLEITWSSSNGNIISGDNTLNPNVDGSGIYEIALKNTINGCIARDNITVNINADFPSLTLLDIQDETCQLLNNGSLAVDNIEGGLPPFNYTLNGNETNDDGLFNDLSPGNYSLQVEDSNGCLLDTSFVIQEGINLELDLPEVLNLLWSESRVIEGITNVPEGDLTTIQWTPSELVSCEDCLQTIVLAVGEQDYQLVVVHKNGCAASARIRVVIEPDASVYIPSGFSPNGDGTNDYFTLFSNETVTEIESMMIVDRWGEIILEKNNFLPNEELLGWDGTFRGQVMDPAVFVYVIEVRLTDGRLKLYSGDLTLVR